MKEDAQEPLWKEVVIGDREPWRRGRVLLVCVGVLYLLAQVLLFLPPLFAGAVEATLSMALAAAVSWLLFAFVWLGLGWMRWILGGYSFLVALAMLIWSVRDGAPLLLVGVAVNGFVGVAFLAPAVHHFAVRQRERIGWGERAAVLGVFVLLMGSLFSGLVAFTMHGIVVQQNAREYAETAMRRLFVEKDTAFLQAEATEPFVVKYGNHGLSQLMARRYMSMGEVRELELTGATMQTRYAFPASISYDVSVFAFAQAECGGTDLRLLLKQEQENWRIHGFYWQCR